MRRFPRWIWVVAAGGVTIGTGAWWLFCSSPLLYVRSDSIPAGWYWGSGGEWHKGSIVLIECQDEAWAKEGLTRGYVQAERDGQVRLVKIVAATEGDWIDQASDGRLLVNGQPWPNSAAKATDGAGRPMAQSAYPYRVAAGQILLMGDHPASFDGRYFGPVPAEGVMRVVRPVWTDR